MVARVYRFDHSKRTVEDALGLDVAAAREIREIVIAWARESATVSGVLERIANHDWSLVEKLYAAWFLGVLVKALTG